MAGQMITDGTGDGYNAGVNSKNRLLTDSSTFTQADQASEDGNSYNFNTGVINLSAATKSAVFYIKNNGEKNINIVSLFYLLGNSTGGTGDMLITVLKNPTAGTIVTNATDMEMAGVNRNFGSSNTLTVNAYKGAEGDTFTDGTKVIESIFNTSPTRSAITVGNIVLQKGNSIGIEITPGASNTDMDVEFAASVFVKS